MLSIEESVWNFALANPDKTAIISGKSSVPYRDLCRNIFAACETFKNIEGYAVGKSVILAADKQLGFVYAYFGAHLAGLTAVPIDAETNPSRFEFICQTVSPFCVAGFKNANGNFISKSLKDFETLELAENVEPHFPNMENVADILFTTGTTGTPKGVPLTFTNEAAAARNINTFMQNTTDDVELLALPISHSFGLGRLRCCLSNGQAIILQGSFVNVKRIFRYMEEYKVTGFCMVPSSWKFLQKMSGNQLGNFANQLKYIEMGSAYFSENDKRELANLLPNTRVAMHYGLTEASRSAFMEFHEDDKFLNSVGKASPFTDIQIYDENGNMLPNGEEGEIAVKGEHVTKGYLNVAAQDNFFGEYFRTGDWGIKNNEGYIFLKSRKKELINVGGKKVSPIEVEDVLNAIDGIEESACIGIPDPNGVLGEVVKAFLVKKLDAELTFESIAASMIGKLEEYKIPAAYEWIDEIPKTSNGKIQRGLLK